MGDKSVSRFNDCHQICQLANLLADLGIVTKSASQQICWQKWGVFLPADFQTVTKSARRNGGESAGRFSDCHQVWKSANLPAEIEGVFLPEDLLTVRNLPAEMGGISDSKITDCQEICQQIYFFYSFCIKGLVLMLFSYIFLHLNICIQFLMQNQYHSLR